MRLPRKLLRICPRKRSRVQKERRVSKLSLAVPCPRASAALAGAAAAIAAIDYQVLSGLISGLFQRRSTREMGYFGKKIFFSICAAFFLRCKVKMLERIGNFKRDNRFRWLSLSFRAYAGPRGFGRRCCGHRRFRVHIRLRGYRGPLGGPPKPCV